jgi:hypothetical protein
MIKNWIALLGANATGKSTRVTEYTKSLGTADRVLDYTFEKNGEMKTIKGAGHIWGDMMVVGRPTRDGLKWVGGDHTMGVLGSIACVEQFFIDMDELGIKTMVFEAYFGNNSSMYRPERLHRFFENVHHYWFLYDELQQYIDRTENRSGQTWEEKGKDAEASAGWKSNVSYFKSLAINFEQVEGTNSTVQRVAIDAPKDWLVGEMKDLSKGVL